MDKVTIREAADYVAAVDIDGITLTETGRHSAILILERRKDWTPAHGLMLQRAYDNVGKYPHKLNRLVRNTRLGEALEIARRLCRKHLKNQKAKARRRARAARYAAAVAAA